MTAQSGLRKTLQAAFIDTGKSVRASVYDNTTGTPALLQVLVMAEVFPGIYVASFLPSAGVSYLVLKRVYTDGTFTTPDPGYAPSVEDFQCVDANKGQSTGITAVVVPLAPVIGVA